MPRQRRATKACQTDFDLFERRLSKVEEVVQKLQGDIAHLKSTKKEMETQIKDLQSKLENAESDRVQQQRCMNNQRIEDQEILMGLEYQLDTKIPETLNLLEKETTSKMSCITKRIEAITRNTEKNGTLVQKGLQQSALKLDTLQQQLKMRNVVISGFSETSDDINIKQRLATFSKDVLEIENITASDIETAFRCGREADSTKPRNLVVHFKTKKKRDTFYERRKKTPVSGNSENSIYINEDLTLHRAKLFHDARKMKKQGRLHATWTQYGNIMVKRNSEDQPKAVYDHSDLRILIGQADNDVDIMKVDSNPSDIDFDSSEDEL